MQIFVVVVFCKIVPKNCVVSFTQWGKISLFLYYDAKLSLAIFPYVYCVNVALCEFHKSCVVRMRAAHPVPK